MHFGKGHNQSKLIFMDAELEKGSTSDDLQRGQNDFGDIHVWNEDIASDLTDMLQKAEVKIFILQPCQFQVSINVGAIGVAISQILVMMFTIGRYRHPTIRTNADCKTIKPWLFNKHDFFLSACIISCNRSFPKLL